MLPLEIKYLENADYEPTHDAMLARILARINQKKSATCQPDTISADELWIVDHNNVFTLGQAGKATHILQRDNTPIIKTDRGGQVTWHGHGQLVVYFLFDLNALGWGVRDLVCKTETIIIDVIAPYLQPNFYAKARADAPGVYVYNLEGMELGKIASLGFKIKQGFSYHGIAINVQNDLSPFQMINPCGYVGMTMLRLADFADVDYADFTQELVERVNQERQKT